MAESLEDISVRITGDARGYEMAIKSSIEATNRLTQTIGHGTGQIQGIASVLTGYGTTVTNVLQGLIASIGISGFLGTIQSAISKAAETEQTEIAFKSLIGNVEEAQQSLKDLRKFAVDTPFEVPEILAAAKQMLAYGEESEKIVPTMQRLGDVAAGLNIPLGQLTYLYGTLKSSGRVMTVDMRQFAGRGIPIWLELAKVLGMVDKNARKLTTEQSKTLSQMVTKGKIDFKMIEQAFINMTGVGGRFFNLMKDQSFSLNGIISNLKDSMGLLLADIGTQIIEGFDLKRVVQEVGAAAQAFGKWFKEMEPGTKKMLFVIAAVVAGMGVLIAVVLLAKVAFATVAAVIATVGWPFLIVVGLIIAAVATWVNSVGGVGKALDIIKAKAIEFWEWLLPIRQAIVLAFETLWDVGVQVWGVIKTAAMDAWKAITGDTEMNWTKIRDFIIDAILRPVYVIKEFSLVMETAWARITYIVVDSLNQTYKAAAPLIGMVANFDSTVASLKQKYEGLRARVTKGYNEFRDKAFLKPADVVKPEEAKKIEKDAENLGDKVGQAINKGVRSSIQSVDTLLFGSGEFLRKLDDYLDRLRAPVAGGVAGGAGGGPQVQLAPEARAEQKNGNQKIEDLLTDIRDNLRDGERDPSVNLDGADVQFP